MRDLLFICAVISATLACSPKATETPTDASTTSESPTGQAAPSDRLTLPSDRCSALEGFERMRCVDPELKRMDDELASLVARQIAHSDHDGKADARAEQAKWQREVRNPCMALSASKRGQCFAAAYTSRMNAVRDAL
ncbi:MAG: hypothetical protein AAGC71_06025 [Pseudomonadota bacterium]